MSKYVFMKAQVSESGKQIPKYAEMWRIKDNSFPGIPYGVFEKGQRIMVLSSAYVQDYLNRGVIAKVVDVTPTWENMLDLYMQVLEDPTTSPDAKSKARLELRRMATLADKYNEYVKSQKAEGTEG